MVTVDETHVNVLCFCMAGDVAVSSIVVLQSAYSSALEDRVGIPMETASKPPLHAGTRSVSTAKKSPLRFRPRLIIQQARFSLRMFRP
jgi:hypothetical protein